VRRALISAAALVAFGLATAAGAQSGPSAEDDLDCALLSAVEASKSDDATGRKGMFYMMFYFSGRWEGATGRKFEVAMTERALADAEQRTKALTDKCYARAADFRDRMKELAPRIKKAGP
jgi:hypothetical protein